MAKGAMRRVLKNSLFFSLGVVASKAVSLAMLPLYTRYLTDTEYGISATLAGFVTTFGIVVMLSLRAAMMRFVNDYKGEQRKRFFGTILSAVCINGALIAILMMLARDLLVRYMFPGIEFYPMVLFGILALMFDAVYLVYQSLLQSLQQGKAYVLNSIVYMLVQAALNAVFIAGFKLGALGMILGLFAANFFFSVYGIVDMLRKKLLVIAFDLGLLRRALSYSLPILPHNIASPIATYASKLMLNISVSYGATGLYSVSSQISSIMTLVQSSINLAFRPWFNEQMGNDQDGRQNIKRFSVLAFTIYSVVGIAVALFAQEFIDLLADRSYYQAWKIVPLLSFATIVNFIYYTHILAVMYSIKGSRFAFICSLTGCFANIFLAYALIPAYSSWGAAVAYLIAQIIRALATVIYSRKVEKVDFGLPSMMYQIVFCLITLAIGLTASYWYDVGAFEWTNLIFKACVFIASALVLLWPGRKLIFAHLKKFRNGRRFT